MALYLTDTTPPARDSRSERHRARGQALSRGCDDAPDAGVTRLDATYPALETMAEIGMPLCVHGEVTDSAVDVFDREAVFIDRILDPLRRRIPALRIVFEHITTARAVDYVKNAANVAATITPHHLLLDRGQLFAGGLRPHHYCLPVLKTAQDRVALLAAATSGDARFFLGTDSAPHSRAAKESACASAGIYSAHAAIEPQTAGAPIGSTPSRAATRSSIARRAARRRSARATGVVRTRFLSLRGDSLVPWRAGECVAGGSSAASTLATRFRGFQPSSTSRRGFARAPTPLSRRGHPRNADGDLQRKSTVWHHVQPSPAAAWIRLARDHGHDPHHPLRPGCPSDALQRVFREVRPHCAPATATARSLSANRADLVFNAAVTRSGIAQPFIPSAA